MGCRVATVALHGFAISVVWIILGDMKLNLTPVLAAALSTQRRSTLAVTALILTAVTGVGGIAAYAQSASGDPEVSPARAVIAKPQSVGAAQAVTRPIVKSGPKRPAPLAAKGCGSAGAIGVTREQVIDSSTGPRYGHQQFKDMDFLHDGEVVLTIQDFPAAGSHGLSLFAKGGTANVVTLTSWSLNSIWSH